MRARVEEWLDWPQAWAAAALVAVLVLALIPLPFGFGTFGPGLALGCLVVGGWLMGKALLRMRALRTTVNPRGAPSALVTDSVFAISRNPIYLGDAFLLLAATFWGNTILGLLVVAGFVWVVTQRFITVEEERLADAFGDTAAEWFLRVRRWI